MFSDQSHPLHDAGARPRRERRPPAWMQDYVTYPAQQQVGDAYEQQQSYPSVERSVERIARMTSLTPPPPVEQWSVFEGARARNPYEDEYSLPLPSSTPVHYRQRPAVEDTSATVALLHRVLDDNQRMQRQMMEMQQRLDTRSTPPPPLSSQMPATAQIQVYNAPLTQDHSQLLPPPPPAQVFSFTSPTDTNEYWPPPPPPVSDDFIKPLPPPPPPQTVVSELTGLVRGMTVTPQEQPQHLADLHQTPLRVQTPEYCSPYTPPRYESAHIRPLPPPQHEMVYRGPKPTIPPFTKGDPREFARLKVALENLLPEDATERFKYQILLDHLKHEDALLIADSYINSAQPYTDTMSSLTERYGQPHQLALRKIADLMESSSIARGDTAGFKRFALRVRALVGLLEQLDILPYRSEKLVVRSRQDQEAMQLLETKTTRVDIQGVQRYATPLLRVKNMPQLKAPKEAVLANLRSTEKRLKRDPEKAAAYCNEIDKLESAGYVSIPTAEEAKHLVDKLKALLAAGGFDLRQWASNKPETIKHLPKEARSESSELWLQESSTDPQELALGLRWLCNSDTLRYKYQLLEPPAPTMRNIYRVLARLYDPLGFIVPFTTRAKVLVQRLWDKQREWDDPSLPEDILQPWLEWEAELPHLSQVTLPRCYVSPTINTTNCLRDIHVFADASERAYGSVAYLRSEDTNGQVEVSFLTARSRVAPKKQQSMPRLELCAALTAAQLAALLQHELTLSIDSIFLWTDSTTVLTWLHSDSCRFKVFVGTRVAEIQELTDPHSWRYVNSAQNPADDVTRGKTLQELSNDGRWRHGPAFLQQSPECWPVQPTKEEPEEDPELRKPAISCLITTTVTATLQSQADQCSSFTDLIETVALSHHGAAPSRLHSRPQIIRMQRETSCNKSNRRIFQKSIIC
ncbi:hypothetical protein WMY93_033500 [Mugilogobius chulae]|uniref:Uncharacterized protein n=1 Tax=Mugilogobius chulae TaxID=88201 RepID=A0AAW0MRU0_9GOBI